MPLPTRCAWQSCCRRDRTHGPATLPRILLRKLLRPPGLLRVVPHVHAKMKSSAGALAQDSSLWCFGLRNEGTRPLTQEERQALSSRVLFSAALGGAALAALFLALAAPLVLLLVAPAPLYTEHGTLAVILWAVVISLAAAWAKTRILRTAQLNKDAAAGMVLVFQGPLADMPEDRTYRALLRQALLILAANAVQTIEVLPHSNAIWRINGKPPRGWLEAPVVQVAQVPAFAALAAEWVQAGEIDLGRPALSGRRDLTAAEVQEIRRRADAMIHKRLGPAVLFTATALAVLWTYNGRIPASVSLPFAWIAAIASFSILVLALAAATAIQYRRDAALGRVLIVRFVISTDAAEGAKEELTPPMEVLPFSRAPWTEDGLPARWRRTATR